MLQSLLEQVRSASVYKRTCFRKVAGDRLVTDTWGPRCAAHSAVFS